jgi:glycosyltransferase involved in cell wall biosynthesis
MQETRLSVALVTRNRPSSLERTLRSLRNQAVQPSEVIISDDSDSDRAAEVRGIANAYQCQYISGPHRGLYANRNHVALACGGTHIRSMDDDHEFPPGHIEECMAAIDRDRNAIWIIGEFLPGQQRENSVPECPGQLHPRGFSVAPPNPDACWAISDGASIYPREIFDRGLRFAEEFRFGAAYLEFGSRLQFLGYRIRQLQSTHVLHHFEVSKRSLADPEGELAAEFFAMLCHSFIYQPSLKNKLLSLSQIGWMTLRNGKLAKPALRKAATGYRSQARLLNEFSLKQGIQTTVSS